MLGIAIGVGFVLCFGTGIVDYLSQHPPSWFHLPARPINLYRINEGVHVVTGVALIPLVLAKLWAVWPKLFDWPPMRGIAHAAERLSLVPLVGGSIFLLFTGVLNIDYWYTPMQFFFPTAHYWAAWLVMGALLIHVGAKATVVRTSLARKAGPKPEVAPRAAKPASPVPSIPPAATGGLSRRGFVGAAAAAAGVLVLTVAGETVQPLRKLALLAPRNPVVGPQGIPVNQSAVQAGVTRSAVDPAYRLLVTGRVERPLSLSVSDLRSFPQYNVGLPISCVEGWSASAAWRGVRLSEVLAMAGARPNSPVRVESLETAANLYSRSVIDAEHIADPATLLAMEINGAPLDLDHGFPVRLIAPDRPGELQTKWIGRLVVL